MERLRTNDAARRRMSPGGLLRRRACDGRVLAQCPGFKPDNGECHTLTNQVAELQHQVDTLERLILGAGSVALLLGPSDTFPNTL